MKIIYTDSDREITKNWQYLEGNTNLSVSGCVYANSNQNKENHGGRYLKGSEDSNEPNILTKYSSFSKH